MLDVFEQFNIVKIFDIVFFEKYDISFTNSALAMLLVLFILGFYFNFALKNLSIIPTRVQVSIELIYNLVYNSINSEKYSRTFINLILTNFLFILSSNLLGNTPYSFTITSHISVTIFISSLFFIFVTFFALKTKGKEFFRIFLPPQIPVILMPLVGIIEVISFLSKPLILSLRLSINMIAGHIMIKLVAYLIKIVSIYVKVLAIPGFSIIILFEVFISILQAYIFMLLSCTYLNDILESH